MNSNRMYKTLVRLEGLRRSGENGSWIVSRTPTTVVELHKIVGVT